MHQPVLYCILAASLFSPLAVADEMNPLRPQRINSHFNDTFACVCYRESLSLANGPVLYVIGVSGSTVQFAESFGYNLKVETADGELRYYQCVGNAGVRRGEEIQHTFSESVQAQFWHYDGFQRVVILIGAVFPDTNSAPLISIRGQDVSTVNSYNARIQKSLIEHDLEMTESVLKSWLIEMDRIIFFGVEGKGWFSLKLNEWTIERVSVEHAISEGLAHSGSRIATLQFLCNNPRLAPVAKVKEISVNSSISAIQRALAGLALANAGEAFAEVVLNEFILSEDEEVRAIAEEGLYEISNK